MKVSDLASVFHGSAMITRPVETGPNRLRIDTLFDDRLGKLTDQDLLNAEIKTVVNIPGSTLRDGIPFLNIYID